MRDIGAVNSEFCGASEWEIGEFESKDHRQRDERRIDDRHSG